jgi:dTMP kinase
MTGMFIVFDGVDGSGKSTQLRLAAEYLRGIGRMVCCCSDPGSTALGKRLREILLGRHETPVSLRSEMLLFMAARAQLVEDVVRPALARGEFVLCDRYTIATLVYQGHAGGLPLDDIRTVNQVATGKLWPDLTLLFDLPVDLALARIGPRELDRLESRGRQYLENVRHGFLAEARHWPRGVEVIDASGTTEEVFSQTARYLHGALEAQP